MSYGAPGPGRYITIYANPGHAYMVVHGRRFDTTGAGRQRLALAVGHALVIGLHRAASSWSLTSIADAQALFSA